MPHIDVELRDSPNPLDQIERIASSRDWFVDRAADDEVNMIVDAAWGDLQVSLNWREDIESLLAICSFDLKVQPLRREEVARLVGLINEHLCIGHFDLWRHDGAVMYRNGLILAGGAEPTDMQCERLIEVAVDTCEKYYPALQFVIWAGKTAEEAIASSLLETVGEA